MNAWFPWGAGQAGPANDAQEREEPTRESRFSLIYPGVSRAVCGGFLFLFALIGVNSRAPRFAAVWERLS